MILKVLIISLRPRIATESIAGKMASKRTVQINVKMSEEDFATLKKAAAAHWPDAVLTNSGIVLGLARIGARTVLSTGKKR